MPETSGKFKLFPLLNRLGSIWIFERSIVLLHRDLNCLVLQHTLARTFHHLQRVPSSSLDRPWTAVSFSTSQTFAFRYIFIFFFHSSEIRFPSSNKSDRPMYRAYDIGETLTIGSLDDSTERINRYFEHMHNRNWTDNGSAKKCKKKLLQTEIAA